MKQKDIDIILGESQIKNPEKWENKMENKVIFESEEEAINFIDDTYFSSNIPISGKEGMIKRIKEKGYIRKSDIEILIEEVEAFQEKMRLSRGLTVLEVEMNGLIQTMKAEIKKLKKS